MVARMAGIGGRRNGTGAGRGGAYLARMRRLATPWLDCARRAATPPGGGCERTRSLRQAGMTDVPSSTDWIAGLAQFTPDKIQSTPHRRGAVSPRSVPCTTAELLAHPADAERRRAARRLLKARLPGACATAHARYRVLTERAGRTVVGLAAVQIVARIAGLEDAVRTPGRGHTGAAIGRAERRAAIRSVGASAAVRDAGFGSTGRARRDAAITYFVSLDHVVAAHDATIVVVVVGVVVGVGPVEVGLGPVVDVVEGAWQQKPTSSGASCTSRARHTSRILTDPLGRPSLWRRAQSTEACAGCIVLTAIDRSTPTRRGTRQGNGIDAMVVLACTSGGQAEIRGGIDTSDDPFLQSPR